MLTVYIIKCNDGSFYTGVTADLNKRLYEHENGIIRSAYTFHRRPVHLVFFREFADNMDAIRAEKQIKNWSRKKKEALINNDFEMLKKLAECKNETNGRNRDIPKDSV